ncbi:hypothetical protein H8959_008751 [Pygathrix nigripes]
MLPAGPYNLLDKKIQHSRMMARSLGKVRIECRERLTARRERRGFPGARDTPGLRSASASSTTAGVYCVMCCPGYGRIHSKHAEGEYEEIRIRIEEHTEGRVSVRRTEKA